MPIRFRRNPSIEAAPLQDEFMLFNAATKKFCILNSSAAHIWNRLDEPRTAAELVSSLREQFETTSRPVEDDVRVVLDEFEQLELVSRQL
jgi:hypothetical protein